MSVPSSPPAASSVTATSFVYRFETPIRAASLAGRSVAPAPALPIPAAVSAAASISATTSEAAEAGIGEGSTDSAGSLPRPFWQRRLALPLSALIATSGTSAAVDQGNAGHKRLRSQGFGGGVGAPGPVADAARGSNAAAFNVFGSYNGAASPSGSADDTVEVARAQIRRKVEDEAARTERSPAEVDHLASPSPRGSADLDDSGASRRLRRRRDFSDDSGVHLSLLRNPDLRILEAAAAPHPEEGGGLSPPRVVRGALGVPPRLVRVGSLEREPCAVGDDGAPDDLCVIIPADLLARFNAVDTRAATLEGGEEGEEPDSLSGESAARTPQAQASAAQVKAP